MYLEKYWSSEPCCEHGHLFCCTFEIDDCDSLFLKSHFFHTKLYFDKKNITKLYFDKKKVVFFLLRGENHKTIFNENISVARIIVRIKHVFNFLCFKKTRQRSDFCYIFN